MGQQEQNQMNMDVMKLMNCVFPSAKYGLKTQQRKRGLVMCKCKYFWFKCWCSSSVSTRLLENSNTLNY